MRTDEISARLDAATPGPWIVDTNEPFSRNIVGIRAQNGYVLILEDQDETECPISAADAALIANAPSDLRHLLDENAVLRKALEMACKAFEAEAGILTRNEQESMNLDYERFVQHAREAIEHGQIRK